MTTKNAKDTKRRIQQEVTEGAGEKNSALVRLINLELS